MAFFRNDTINLLNLHYGIHSLALSGGGAFLAAFLRTPMYPRPRCSPRSQRFSPADS